MFSASDLAREVAGGEHDYWHVPAVMELLRSGTRLRRSPRSSRDGGRGENYQHLRASRRKSG